jgi:cbb3-type cytochrome oxidase cytochrome c subunit
MLATFVATRSEKELDAWQNAPESAIEGALIYQSSQCANCHKLNSVGGDLGPPLNGIGERRDRRWIEEHFADPSKLSPDSIMPSYAFLPLDLKLLTDYITSIPK